jgi:hypothetical protein
MKIVLLVASITPPTKFKYKMLHEIMLVLLLLHKLHLCTHHVGTTDDRLCENSGSQHWIAESQSLLGCDTVVW